MIKVQNGIATREPLPGFLQGLALESLANLSWTDASLGVQDCAWWPEEDHTNPLGQDEKYGDEALTLDAERKIVVVNRQVLAMTAEEIADREAGIAARKQAQRDQINAQIATLQSKLEELGSP